MARACLIILCSLMVLDWAMGRLINTVRYPILVAGSGGGKFITGKHLNVSAKSGLVKKVGGTYKTPEGGVPLANLWLSQANAMGLKLDRFADSTGMISSLFA